MPKLRQRNDVELQNSPMIKTSTQVSGTSTVPFLGNQTGSRPIQSLNDSKKRQFEIHRLEMNVTANENGDDNISLAK